MSANPFTIVTNDPATARKTGVSRHSMQEAQAGAQTDDEVLDDEFGPVFSVGRGASDASITYVSLYNTAGVKCYIFPNAAGNGIIVQTSKP